MPGEPHAPFPGFSAPSSSRGPPLPKNSQEILQLINAMPHPDQIVQFLIPSLEALWKMTEGRDGRAVEQALGVPELKLEELGNDDVRKFSAALIHVLIARLLAAGHRSGKAENELFNHCARLAVYGHPEQFGLCPARVTQFAQLFLRLAVRCKKVAVALDPLVALVESGQRYHLSGIHAVYLEACLITRSPGASEAVIEQPYSDVSAYRCTYPDIITFYHHAGLIAAAGKDFDRAKELFTTAVSVPTQAASAIQLLAAKRAILCELLLTGKNLQFPKYTAGVVLRAIEKQAGQYVKLAQAFEARNWSSVNDIAKSKIFAEDCNAGLLQQVIASMTRRRVLKVGDVYSRLTMDQLLEKLGSKGDQGLANEIRGLISTGQILANVTESATGQIILSFPEDDPQYDLDSQFQIQKLKTMAEWLERQLTDNDRRLGVDKKYLQKQVNNLEIAGGKGSGKNGRMDEFEELVAAEEAGAGGRGFRRGGGKVGNDYGDAGF